MRHHHLAAWLCLACLLAGRAAPAAEQPPCDTIGLTSGSLDIGWNGNGHGLALPEGEFLALEVLSRCDGSGPACLGNADCATGETCQPTCDTSGATPSDDVCELFASAPNRCTESLVPCTTNADCESGETCEQFTAPPIPIAVASTPGCLTFYLDDGLTGTVDIGSGASSLSFVGRVRTHLGITLEQPCPSCGAPEDKPKIGDELVCSGGSRDGQPCLVDAVSKLFGGVSFDCPPGPETNLSGSGLYFGKTEATTETLAKQAVLPCAPPLDNFHPAGANPMCIDNFLPCSSNADCMRCLDDLSACTTNADCPGGSECAAAPAQPVTCGVYCHCGYCDEDPTRPCFGNDDCEPGETCAAGTGVGGLTPQKESSDCANYVCGEDVRGRCCDRPDCIGAGMFPPTLPVGTCSLEPYRSCASNAACAGVGAGECVLEPRPCFENVVRTAGERNPLQDACDAPGPPQACTTNAECTETECVPTCPQPTYAAPVCITGTASAAVNDAVGLPGPAVIRLTAIVPEPGPTTTTTTIDSTTTTSTTTTTFGAPTTSTTTITLGSATTTTSTTTTVEPATTTTLPPPRCGQPVSTLPLPTTTDCLYILNAAVQFLECNPECICDVDGSGSIAATDTLLCLQVALLVPGAELNCSCE